MKRRSAIVLLWAFTFDIPANGADATIEMPLKAASAAAADDGPGSISAGISVTVPAD